MNVIFLRDFTSKLLQIKNSDESCCQNVTCCTHFQNIPYVNFIFTYQSQLLLIYTAWDVLWCVWSWLHRFRSMMHTGHSRSKLNTCTVDLWSCPLNTRRSSHLKENTWNKTTKVQQYEWPYQTVTADIYNKYTI